MAQARFEGMDLSAEGNANIIRFNKLWILSGKQQLQGLLPEIEALMAYSQKIRGTYNMPGITLGTCEYFLCVYYIGMGQFLQGYRHAIRAMEATGADACLKPSGELQGYALVCLTRMNDWGQLTALREEMQEKLAGQKLSPGETAKYRVILTALEKRLGVTPEKTEENGADLLEAFYNSLGKPNPFGIPESLAAAQVVGLMDRELSGGQPDRKTRKKYEAIVDYILENPGKYGIYEAAKLPFYFLLAKLHVGMGSPRTMDTLGKLTAAARKLGAYDDTRMQALQSAALGYHYIGQRQKAAELALEALEAVDAGWKNAVSVLNLPKAGSLLEEQRYQCSLCYSVLRGMLDTQDLYEQVLRHKDLPFLAMRERSRLLSRLPRAHTPLKQEIYRLQDALARQAYEALRDGGTSRADTAQRLLLLEGEFAETYGGQTTFTDITYRAVADALAPGEGIVEYYFALSDEKVSSKDVSEEDLLLDIFVTVATGQGVRLTRLTVEKANTIVSDAEALTALLQEGPKRSNALRRHSLQEGLYTRLLAPVMPLLEGLERVYLAPDAMLCNVPFESLGADGAPLSERMSVVRMISGRELLYRTDSTLPERQCFVLGDPDYGTATAGGDRNPGSALGCVGRLPFSAPEASLVAKRWGVAPCLGGAATKHALEAALPCRVVHLATHGYFEEEKSANAFYASRLLFAGYNPWVAGDGEQANCGNGILTADEISRLDMRGTEVVVLSACQTGLGNTAHGGLQGLLSAFAAAGARWVVCHMWQASDLAAPVLMDAFHEGLEQGLSVPKALEKAKESLKNITVGDLKKLQPQLCVPLPTGLSERPDGAKPFADPHYWGGVVCYRCT